MPFSLRNISHEYQHTCQLCVDFEQGVGHRITQTSDLRPEDYQLGDDIIEWAIGHFKKVHIFYFNKNEIDIDNLEFKLRALNFEQLNRSKYFQVQHRAIS